MDLLARARLLLAEIEAVRTTDQTDLSALLALTNEVFRDAQALARAVVAEKYQGLQQVDKDKK